MTGATRFLRWWLIGLSGVALVWSLHMVALDPFALYGVRLPWGLNVCKEGIQMWPMAAKPHRLREVQPDTVLFGSSRVLHGFSARSDVLRRHLGRSFNLAISGPNVLDCELMLRRSAAGARFTNVLIGLDHGFFQRDSNRIERKKLERVEMVMPSFAEPAAAELADAIFSWNTARAGWRFLGVNEWQSESLYGFVPDNGVQRGVRGCRARFGVVEAAYVAPLASLREKFEDPELLRQQWASLARIIDLAAANKWRLGLFVEPIHARFHELRLAVGIRAEVEAWMVRLAGIVAAARERGVAIELRDFATYTPVTTETIPEYSDRLAHMRYFHDSSHFASEVGDLLVETMAQQAGGGVPGEFGCKLTPENIRAHLVAVRAQRDVYARSHPQELEEVRLLVLRQARYHGLVF
jgi:hypothetical protein